MTKTPETTHHPKRETDAASLKRRAWVRPTVKIVEIKDVTRGGILTGHDPNPQGNGTGNMS